MPILTDMMSTAVAKNPLILAGVLSALCVALGYLFLMIPNVEMITAAVFISGAIMGPAYGALIGAVSEGVYSLFNPYGAPAPPLLIAQVGVFALIGCCGGWAARLRLRSMWLKAVVYGSCGLLLTLLFDLLTTLSFSLILSGYDLQKSLAFFVTGMPFYLVHSGVNLIIFAATVPWVITRLQSTPIMRGNVA